MSNDKKPLGRIALQKQPTQGNDPSLSIEALRALSEKYGVPGLDLTQVAIPLDHLTLLPREIAVRHGVLPVLVQDERIFLAMANPDDKRVIDELEFVTGKRVFPYVAPANALSKVIDQSYELKLRGCIPLLCRSAIEPIQQPLGVIALDMDSPHQPVVGRALPCARLQASHRLVPLILRDERPCFA